MRAARYDLFAGDYAFNNTHLQVIDAVTSSYFRLLDSEGQVAAAEANLKNAQTVADQVNARLNNGLATLPDALEARAAAAQAAYELASLQGAQSIAEASLATTLRLPASTVLPTVPLDRLAPATALVQTVEDATARALHDRPDLLEQEARVAAADWRIHQARTAYLPQIVFSGQEGPCTCVRRAGPFAQRLRGGGGLECPADPALDSVRRRTALERKGRRCCGEGNGPGRARCRPRPHRGPGLDGLYQRADGVLAAAGGLRAAPGSAGVLHRSRAIVQRRCAHTGRCGDGAAGRSPRRGRRRSRRGPTPSCRPRRLRIAPASCCGGRMPGRRRLPPARRPRRCSGRRPR